LLSDVLCLPTFFRRSLPPYLPKMLLLIPDPAVYYAHLAGNRARAHDPSRDRDDESSGSGVLSATRGGVDLRVTPLKPIHANIANSMWWM
jgi:hypothetical protein